MSITKTLFGSTVIVPERKETGWGAQVTNILSRLIDSANFWGALSGTTVVPAFSVATNTLAAAATLTPSAVIHRIQGSGGAVTLDTTTPIAAGVNGRPLFLVGADAANTVTIQDSGTVDLETDIELALGEGILLVYNSTTSKWEEVCRSNVQDFRNNLALRLYEARANGVNKVSLGVPASLAADYSFTLPSALPGANTRVLIISSAGQVSLVTDGTAGQVLTTDGAGTYSFSAAGAGTLQSAYDGGNTITMDTDIITIGQANNVAMIDLNKTGAGAGDVFDLENDGTGRAFHLKQDGNVASGACFHIEATVDQSSPVFLIDKTGAGAGILMRLNNDGTGHSLEIQTDLNARGINIIHHSSAEHAIYVSADGLAGGGTCATFEKTSTNGSHCVRIVNSGTGRALQIEQFSSAGVALRVDSNQNANMSVWNKTGAGTGDCMEINDAGTGITIEINKTANGAGLTINKTGLGAGNALTVDNDGTGIGVSIIQDGAENALQIAQNGADNALDITQASNNFRAMIIRKTGTGTNPCIDVDNDGTGAGFNLQQDGAGQAITVTQNGNAVLSTLTQTQNQNLLELTKTGAGAGAVILIANSGTGNDITGTSSTWFVTPAGNLNAKALTTPASAVLTIATGAVTAVGSYHQIDTEAAAATDDLDTINTALPTGTFLVVRASNAGRTVVMKDGTGNLALAGDFSLNNDEDTMLLFFVGTVWYELARSDNGA